MITLDERIADLSEAWRYSAHLIKTSPSRFDITRLEILARFIEEEFNLSRVRNSTLRALLSQRLLNQPKPLAFITRDSELSAVIEQVGRLVLHGDTLRLRASITDLIIMLDRGDYVSSLCTSLREGLLGSEWEAYPYDVILDELIAAFLCKGFEIDEIADILPSALSPVVEQFDDGFVYVRYPAFPFDEPGYDSDESTLKAHSLRKAEHVRNATPDEKLASVVRLYQRPEREFRYIVQVKGLRVATAQRLGPVDLYPVQRRFIHHDDSEKFNETQDQRSNISVVVSAHALNEGRQRAFRKLQVACDVLNAWFSSTPPIELSDATVHVVDAVGALLHTSSHNVDANSFHHPYSSLDFDKVRDNITFWSKIERAAERCIESRTIVDERLRTALSFLSKGESSDAEDAILYYWIGIDALFTVQGRAVVLKSENSDKNKSESIDKTEDLAMKFFPAATALQEKSRKLQALYERLAFLWNNRHQNRASAIMADVTDDLVNRSQLVPAPYQTFNLSNFLSTLPEWQKCLPRGPARRHVEGVQKFFEDPVFTCSEHHSAYRRAALETALIYQIRNRLVHHAHAASSTLSFLRMRAAAMLKLAINYASDERMEFPEAIALTLNIWERLELRLKSKRKFDLWAYTGYVRGDAT